MVTEQKQCFAYRLSNFKYVFHGSVYDSLDQIQKQIDLFWNGYSFICLQADENTDAL
jgi:hypothetical protein